MTEHYGVACKGHGAAEDTHGLLMKGISVQNDEVPREEHTHCVYYFCLPKQDQIFLPHVDLGLAPPAYSRPPPQAEAHESTVLLLPPATVPVVTLTAAVTRVQ